MESAAFSHCHIFSFWILFPYSIPLLVPILSWLFTFLNLFSTYAYFFVLLWNSLRALPAISLFFGLNKFPFSACYTLSTPTVKGEGGTWRTSTAFWGPPYLLIKGAQNGLGDLGCGMVIIIWISHEYQQTEF